MAMDLRKHSPRFMISTGTLVLTLSMFTTAVHAESIKTVFVIAMENHNWTQPANDASAPLQIFQDPNAPYINSLTNPASPNSAQVSFANAYTNVLATPSGNNPSIHPSEPNYIWMEGAPTSACSTTTTPMARVARTRARSTTSALC